VTPWADRGAVRSARPGPSSAWLSQARPGSTGPAKLGLAQLGSAWLDRMITSYGHLRL